jgi:hypothetical protein
LHDDVGDDLIRSRIALRRAIGVLDDVHAHRPDEPVGADLQNLVCAGIRGQHQCHDGRAKQHAAVGGLRFEPDRSGTRAPAM